MASVSASYYMFLRMARLQKVYHCKVFHMPFSLSLCATLYVSVHLLLLNLRCFLQRCIYIIFYDANIFLCPCQSRYINYSWALVCGYFEWYIVQCQHYVQSIYCIWRPRNDVIVLNILDGFHYINSYQIKSTSERQNGKRYRGGNIWLWF